MGGLGALMVTTPAKYFELEFGWRALCFLMAALTLIVAAVVFFAARDKPQAKGGEVNLNNDVADLKSVYTDPFFWQLAPLVAVCNGTFIAMLGLWMGPWLQHVAGNSPLESANYLFTISLGMTIGFACGGVYARLAERLGQPIVTIVISGIAIFIAIQIVLALNVAPHNYLIWAAYGFFAKASMLSFALFTRHFGAALSGRVVTGMNIFILRQDDTIGRSLLRYGEWTHGEIDVIGRMVKPGMVVADIGANFGTHTLAMAKMVGPEGRVVSVEPQRLLFRILSTNLLLNGCRNVVAMNAGIADVSGWMDVPEFEYDAVANFGKISLADRARELSAVQSLTPIPQLRLDDIPAMRNAGLIKVDVEGMEKAVLAGAEELIARRRPVLYIENEHPGEKSEALIRYISERGYTIYWDVAPMFSESNFFGDNTNVFGKRVCVNMLCVPADREHPAPNLRQLKRPDEHPRLGL